MCHIYKGMLCLLLWMPARFVLGQVDFNNYQTLLSKGSIPVDFTKETYVKIEESIDKKTSNSSAKEKEKIFIEGINYGIDEILHSGMVTYGDEISTYILDVTKTLLKDKPELLSKLRFYVIKSTSPNAFSTDQGIIFVTTGLIAQLTSEAQLAFILAHEIVHFEKKHVRETFDWRTKNYRQNDYISKLSNYAKDKEFEADKLAINYYHKAGYSKDEILKTFDVLMYSYLPFDEVAFPNDYFNTSTFYVPSNLFSTKKYEIKAKEDYDDSKSSHPNIKKRREAVLTEINSFNNWQDKKNLLGDQKFNEILTIARFETVRCEILDGDYGKALYSIFLLEQENPNSIYLKRLKAQTWLNILVFKKNNSSAKTLNKISELEGESAHLHLFLRNLSLNGYVSIALRQIYDIHSEFPEDLEIKAIYSRLISVIASIEQNELKNFPNLTYLDAQAKFIASKNDTTQHMETKVDVPKSKYDKIKQQKDLNRTENFDSTKFYVYGMYDIVSSDSFIRNYKIDSSRFAQKKIELENYKSLSFQEKKLLDKQNTENQYKLGLTDIIVVEPLVMSYKRSGTNNVKSEKLEAVFAQSIYDAAEMANTNIYEINSRLLETKGTEGFNERSILTSFLGQISMAENIDFFPVDYNLLQDLKQKYGTSKVMFSLVEYAYEGRVSIGMVILGGIIFYPSLGLYIPLKLFTANRTEINILILDLDKGSIVNGMNYRMKDAPKKWQLTAHMYSIFSQFQQFPK